MTMARRCLTITMVLLALLLPQVAWAAPRLLSLQMETRDWRKVLYRGLQLWYQGEYEKCYTLIADAVRNSRPGPEVHRCLALMRLSFLQMHGTDTLCLLSSRPLSASAAGRIRELEAVANPTDIDLVFLATLRGVAISRTASKASLD